MGDCSYGGNENRRSVKSRRHFLRQAAPLTIIGFLSGCVELELDDFGAVDWSDDEEPDTFPAPDDVYADEQTLAYEQAIHDRVNAVRLDHDRNPLAKKEAIAAVARAHSADMVEREYFAHESPDGEGPGDRLDDFMPNPCRMIGENLANVGLFPENDDEVIAERVVSGWMDSAGHRENLLRDAFDVEGIGVAIREDDRVYVTQKLCAKTT